MATNHPKSRVIKICKELASSFDDFYIRDWENTRTVIVCNDFETVMLTMPAPKQKLAEGETWHLSTYNHGILKQLVEYGTVVDGPFAYYTELPQKAQNRYERIQNILATDTNKRINMTRDNFRLLIKRLYNADCHPNEDKLNKIVIVNGKNSYMSHSTEGRSLLVTITIPKSSQDEDHIATILPYTVFAFVDKLLSWSCNVTLIPGDDYLLITTPNFYYLFEYPKQDVQYADLPHSYETARTTVKYKVEHADVISVTRKEFETNPTKFKLLNAFLRTLAKYRAFRYYESDDTFQIQYFEVEHANCTSKFSYIYMTCTPTYGYPVEIAAVYS